MFRVKPQILKENSGASEEKGESARISKFVGATAVSDMIKSTLGPKGMDKIIETIDKSGSNDIKVTNDGSTILSALQLDNAAAKILVNISKTQDEEIGDGTTSVVVLAGELLKCAERLLSNNLHPQTIIIGWRKALDIALKSLEKAAVEYTDENKRHNALLSIARTALSSKVVRNEKDHFAEICVKAISQLENKNDLESVYIIKKSGGTLKDSFISEGFILEKSIGVGQPKKIENAKILVANTAMDNDKIKIFGAKIKTDSMSVLADIEAEEKIKMKSKVNKILNHKINCFINRQLIYNYPEQLFADSNVMAIEHADFEGVERLALSLGAEIASTFDCPQKTKLGSCKLIEEIMIGENRLIHFSGVEKGQACTIVLRGASSHILDEIERSIHDALCVVSATFRDSRSVFGGGCTEILMAKEIERAVPSYGGKEQLAVESFATALREVVGAIVTNAGYDKAELLAELRAAHYRNDSTAGIDIERGTVGDMSALNVTEPFASKKSILLKAQEAAEMIVRADEIITCAPRPREPERGMC